MELGSRPDKQQTAARLAVCVALAVGLFAAAGKLTSLKAYQPWLEDHKVQAIAIAAAVLFGASLALFPPPEPDPDGCPEPGEWEESEEEDPR